MQNPHNLVVTPIAEELAPQVYAFVQTLPRSERWNLAHQLIKSSTSARNNIHEGCRRQGNKALLPFLHYANGSASEMVDQLKLARELRVGDQKQAARAKRKAERLRFLLTNLIASIERRLDSEGF